MGHSSRLASRLSKRVGQIKISATKEMPMIAARVGGCVSLGQGIPSFATPAHVVDAVARTLRDDPAASSNMAAALTGDNRDYLESRIGRSAEPVDLYLAHFLGSGGAAKFLSALETNPDQPGAWMMPEAEGANRSVFYAPDGSMRSLAEIRDRFRTKLENGGKIENMKPFAPAGWHASASSSSGLAGGAGRPPLQMMEIQPMPRKLSMGFAADAYRRLASMTSGAA